MARSQASEGHRCHCQTGRGCCDSPATMQMPHQGAQHDLPFHCCRIAGCARCSNNVCLECKPGFFLASSLYRPMSIRLNDECIPCSDMRRASGVCALFLDGKGKAVSVSNPTAGGQWGLFTWEERMAGYRMDSAVGWVLGSYWIKAKVAWHMPF